MLSFSKKDFHQEVLGFSNFWWYKACLGSKDTSCVGR